MSRQLWWGHRIPAWYCPDGHISVSDAVEGPPTCDICGRPAAELRQETDIFDTWFSSGLWPFSTLGWPDETADLARFYPTSVMETAYEILFFWVARMMMLGLFFTDVEPFHTVYLHGIVRDPYGQKMSKTKGNVVDPLKMIDEIGADALRFALVSGNAPGVDQRLTDAKLTGGRNFTNKLWNAARFALGARPEAAAAPIGEPDLPERWIRSRLADATERANRQLAALDLAGYAATVYDFAWADYCDWFLEAAKVNLRRPETSAGERSRIWNTTVEVLAGLLRILHPLLPFLSEEIWSAARAAGVEGAAEPLLATAAWPAPGGHDPAAELGFDAVVGLIRAVRNARTEGGAPAGSRIPLELAPSDDAAARLAKENAHIIVALARVEPLTLRNPGDAPPDGATAIPSALGAAWLGAGDAAPEADGRRAKQAAEIGAAIHRLRALLANPEFTAKAPGAVVARERKRLGELEEQMRQIEP